MKKIYVSLDELLDTRLGFISIHNPPMLEQIMLEPNEYLKRTHDEIIYKASGFKTKELFYKSWEKRDTEVLKNSVISHIPAIINEVIIEYRSSGEEALATSSTEVHVNLYPYRLDEDEKKEMQIILENAFFATDKVVLINIDTDKLTPKWVKKNYDYIFMYDFNRWVEKHAAELKKTLLVQNHLFVPRLFLDDPTKGNFEKLKEYELLKDLDLFKVIEAGLSTRLNLVFIAASDFGPKLFKPVKSAVEVKDLDSLSDPYVSYTLDNSRFDHQYASHQAPTPSSEVPKD